MYLKANPRVPVLWATETTLRCGDEPRSPTCRVTDQEAALLETAQAGIEQSALEATASNASIPEARLRRLLAFIRPALCDGTEEPESPATTGEFSDATTAPRANELRRRRAAHTVEIAGDTRYLALCEWMLTGAGIPIETASEREIRNSPRPDVNRQEENHEPPNDARAVTGQRQSQRRIGLVIAAGVCHPQLTRSWMHEGIPHIAVTVLARGVDISAPVFPGTTPCLRCRELFRSEHDPRWMLSAAQLAARPVPAIERTVASTVFGLALAHLLAIIDGETAPENGVRVHPYGIAPTATPGFHPDCGCREFSEWLV